MKTGHSIVARAPRNSGATLPVLVLVLGLALVPSALIYAGWRSVAGPRWDSRPLRQTVLQASGVEWTPNIELGVGGGLLGLARAGLSFVDLPSEARAVLGAVRGAEVGVYRLRGGRPDRAGWLEAADRGMAEKGWERIVGVISGQECVAAYLPRDLREGRDVRLCVMVMEGEQLVLVAARGNLDPLFELARSHADWPVLGPLVPKP
jgi:hypothetical protein